MILKKLFLQNFLKVAIKFIRFYWKIVAPSSVGVKILIENEDHRYLLVRHSYKDGWYLPGGGIKKYENASFAAEREVQEETGIKVVNLKFIGVYRAIEDYKNDWIFTFYSMVPNNQHVEIDDIEIIEYKWLKIEELEHLNLNKRSKRIIKDFQNNGSGYHFDI